MVASLVRGKATEVFEVDESGIRAHASPESFRRGEDYYRRGAVLTPTRRGDAVHARVAGSDLAPYHVRLHLEGPRIADAACSCPFDWGGWCKHAVAVALTRVREPATIRELPRLEEALSDLDRDGLQALLLTLAERDPSLADAIENEVSLPASSDALPTNVEDIRRRVRSGLQTPGYADPYDGYRYAGGSPDEARRILDAAWDSIRAGDGREALPVLGAITEEYMDSLEMLEWEVIGDYGGELLDFFCELGAAWTEALLSVDDLGPHEKENYGAKLDVWWGELADYEAGETFGAAFRAIEQGWTSSPLDVVLRGEAPDDASIEDLHDDFLTVARLNVLERRSRHEEYLRLSEAAGETVGHTVMLVRLGRTQEAVEYGLRRLAAPEEALAVAEALREGGDPDAALRVGGHGLSLEGDNGRLAAWVRDLAEEEGNAVLALEAAVIAFRADPGLAPYRRVRGLAGGHWPEYRGGLLEGLRRDVPYYPSGHVDVFLHDGLIEDAIAVVEKSPVEALVARVVDAALDSQPGWVIETCRRLAEGIMDGGKSNHYDEAITWLTKARDAHLAARREDEWRAYLDEIIDRHRRKYKLRPMLERLAG